MSIELLMPAGDVEKMKYAFAFGADAVYLGMPRYSLRARENGFKTKEIVAEAIDYAHKLGKKVYVTANILPHNHKVDPFLKYVESFLGVCKPDAWIMSDPGLIMLMRKHFPNQVIHLSVQANTVNFATAQFWQAQGISRIILSRELSVAEMSLIHENCPGLELEAFVHGAICIAYSGRCLISNYMSHRDPNQGTCSNSCRWEYKVYQKSEVQPKSVADKADKEDITETQQGDEYAPLDGEYYVEEKERPGELMPIDEDEHGTYLMNSKDLCAIEFLDDLRKAGICSFKVEGRTKSVYYVAMVARAYRRAIDDMLQGRPFNSDNLREIFSTSNRGLTSGFVHGNPGHKAQEYEHGRSYATIYRFSGILREYDEGKKLMKIEPRNPIAKGTALELLTGKSTVNFTVEKIFNDKMQEVDQIHGGMSSCYIPYQENPGEFVLFREYLNPTGRTADTIKASASIV